MDHKEDFFLTEEAAEWIGQKKSEYLSELIMQLEDDDFGFEEFHHFDHLVPQTLEAPDRAYQDDSGTWPLRTVIRTYQEKTYFHQVVVGALISDQQGQDVFIPVLSFVTRKEELVREWARGIPLPRPTLS